MITESDIDYCITQLENDPSSAIELPEDLIEYLNSEIYPNLKKDEQQLLDFSLNIIYNCCQEKTEDFDIDEYIDIEDSNWSLRDKDRSLTDSMNAFFENYPEEDLLAFVEDILIDDSDQEISIAGKEIIVICSKSLIDLLQGIKT